MVLQSTLVGISSISSSRGAYWTQTEEFAKLFRLQNDCLLADFRNQTESSAVLPPKLLLSIKAVDIKGVQGQRQHRLSIRILRCLPWPLTAAAPPPRAHSQSLGAAPSIHN